MLISLLAVLPACARQPAADTTMHTERVGETIARQVTAAPETTSGRRVQPGPELEAVLAGASSIVQLKAVAVSQGGRIVGTRGFRGSTVDSPTNIKSASKTVLSALAGIAIDKGVLQGTEQRVAEVLERDLPANPDPRLRKITVSHLLSMQAGLESTSGVNYGRWVSSPNWVRDSLSRPFVAEPGGAMVYSTGTSHLLSAMLARASGRSTLALAREWLGPQEGFAVTAWDRDPQGVHLGGNNMAMSTRSLLAFGELYRSGGVARDGTRLLSESWIEQSWQPRTASRYTGDGYGYGWFLRELGGQQVRYAWGYGGQMLYVVPALDLVVAMTSDDSSASARTGHRDDLHGLLVDIMESATPVD
ncbi:6-aminohexanoate-dimer hydrolase [Lysobacter bugurensis]|uniref:6-aminohexanoate-dimer hydrolase n=1 Tax=Cognatilysobacter bugurensis TaxID=543356 RepID=A0A918W9A4_9GAMM|nr:6-aminohexanoate-dimer hydrolase [Lysobacter bugurensis]